MEASISPDSPPMTNPVMKAMQNHIGTAIQIRPPQSVATQLNVFTADGTAIAIVVSMNTNRTFVEIPVTNMWCSQTANESTANTPSAMAIAP